ncbi:MAG: zinc ribbon domain-containing protein, partial [Candidatus Omnitrophica bacterium]|nr:zinc ribbon domain-containing protein [Candidatus Omnitrophota bacterium]
GVQIPSAPSYPLNKMAFYEYFCENCKKKFELIFPIGKAEESPLCPECKKPSRRIFAGFMVFSKSKQESSVDNSTSSGSSCGSCITRNCTSCGI